MTQIGDKEAYFGQLLMMGIPGPGLDTVARELVRDLKVGGIILFARNLESPEQVWQLTHDLQREASEAGSPPLLIALDQEGGPVQRLKAPFTMIPPARGWGLRGLRRRWKALSRRVGRELALVGVNVNLAPVLDVPRSPACPQWDRAYSSDPERVARTPWLPFRGYLSVE